MRIKTLITLLLGLAFQLAQVLPGMSAGAPCAAAAACQCQSCAGGNSCCCMKSGQPDPKPAPQPLHAGDFLKGMAMKTAATKVSVVSWPAEVLPVMLAVGLPAAACGGYNGVRLAVAYCSFVI
ncbi:MAG: hypothetical protein WCO57_10635 [Verrucomicrobiota bacterium]